MINTYVKNCLFLFYCFNVFFYFIIFLFNSLEPSNVTKQSTLQSIKISKVYIFDHYLFMSFKIIKYNLCSTITL